MVKILKYWSKDEIIKALQLLPKDKPINSKNINEYYKQGLICGYSNIHNKFNGFRNACKIANVKYNFDFRKEEKRNKMISILSKLSKNEKYDSKLFYQLFKKNIIPNYRGVFKNIKEMCELSGLEYKNNRYGGLKNRTYEQIYGEKIAKEKKEFASRVRKGKTLEELYYSKEKAEDVKKKLRARKGKTYTELFGEERAKIILEKMNRGGWWIVGKNEKQILDEIEKYVQYRIIRNYAVFINSGRLKRVDGFIQEKNIVIEIDEKYHDNKKVQENDKNRDLEIKKILNDCEIIRITEEKWLKDKNYKMEMLNFIDIYLRIEGVDV